MRSRVALLVVLAPLIGACAPGPQGPLPPGGGAPGEPVPGNPFAPAAMRIHPLTRLERDDRGGAMVVCHVEFRDLWGDTVKASGHLAVFLYRPAGPGDEGIDVQELRWDLDLDSHEHNARLYDPATRTYRAQLAGLPSWVEALLPGAAGGRPETTSIRLRAIHTGLDASGAPRTLSDDHLIAP